MLKHVKRIGIGALTLTFGGLVVLTVIVVCQQVWQAARWFSEVVFGALPFATILTIGWWTLVIVLLYMTGTSVERWFARVDASTPEEI